MQTPIDIPTSWPPQLSDGLAALGLDLAPDRQQLLLAFLGLLAHWNRAFNLTAVRDPAVMVRRQLLDSLAILPWVVEGPVLDVGSGGGLPGIPLAIARPGLAFTLLDSNGKKVRFLRQVVGELELRNVEVIQERIERLDRAAHYRHIVSRAFASLSDLTVASQGLLAPGGDWLAMKGADPSEEIAALPAGLIAEIHPLRVPGEPAARHLVIVRTR